jgi:D-sedoheptulose 7-phosphate isomerase
VSRAGPGAASRNGGPFERVDELLSRRTEANERFFAAAADPLARLCHRMAERFSAGGRLIALGSSPQARSDVRHVAVEFVHPVIVGKRALPAIGLCGDGSPLMARLDLVAEPGDIVLAFDARPETTAALAAARRHGCLTVAFEPGEAEWVFEPPADDPLVRQELVETAYHVLWELVHVFFEHRGLLRGRGARPVHDTGASSFLYPFLGEEEHNLASVLDDVRRSVLMKADEIADLRAQTLGEGREVLVAAAAVVRERLDAGATVLALGNGGSATDAMDAVADFTHPPNGWPARRALDLTEDPAILTAIANDVGVHAIFLRQVIAYGRPDDVLLAISTSGNSENVIAALEEARRRGLATVAMVGYDGGRVAAEALADYVIVTRSEHIPRIQEAQASVFHALRELVESRP